MYWPGVPTKPLCFSGEMDDAPLRLDEFVGASVWGDVRDGARECDPPIRLDAEVGARVAVARARRFVGESSSFSSTETCIGGDQVFAADDIVPLVAIEFRIELANMFDLHTSPSSPLSLEPKL